MKKLLSLLTLFILLFSLASCAEFIGDRINEAAEMIAGEAGPETAVPETVSVRDTEGATVTEEPPDGGIAEDGSYDSKEDVALYIRTYGRLPSNYITKKEAEKLGWSGGSLEKYAPGKCIGGSRFGNYEEKLPDKDGRFWTECDIDTLGKSSRGAKRIVFSNDGLIYYTDDHYDTFTLLFGTED
ncbi:MAG: ribonuclease [Clostridia bacterium]|nr:ribonuclease [Clostridia bacterium]